MVVCYSSSNWLRYQSNTLQNLTNSLHGFIWPPEPCLGLGASRRAAMDGMWMDLRLPRGAQLTEEAVELPAGVLWLTWFPLPHPLLFPLSKEASSSHFPAGTKGSCQIVTWPLGMAARTVLWPFCPILLYQGHNCKKSWRLRPSNSTPRLYPREMRSDLHVKAYTHVFTAVLFIIARKWKQPIRSSTDEWIIHWNIIQP